MIIKKIHADNIIGIEDVLVNASGSLLAINNLSDINNVNEARNNLGLGSASVKNVGIEIGNIPIVETNGKISNDVVDLNGGYF